MASKLADTVKLVSEAKGAVTANAFLEGVAYGLDLASKVVEVGVTSAQADAQARYNAYPMSYKQPKGVYDILIENILELKKEIEDAI